MDDVKRSLVLLTGKGAFLKRSSNLLPRTLHGMESLGRAQRLSLSQVPTNVFYVGVDVVPIFLQTGAQVVQPSLAVAGTNHAILGTLPVTGK